MDNLSAKLFEDTPTITVNDNLGRPVRVVEFNRTNIGDERSVRISRTEFNATGYMSGSSDPRFFLRGLTNQKQQWNLAGQLVRVDSVDAGERLILPDVTGAAHLEWDEKGKRRRYEYDTALHRLVAVHEKVSQDDVSEQVLERWVYGQQEDALFNLNLQVKAHYDLGGCLETQAISLTGQPLSQRRRLLWDYSAQSDWQGGSPNEWNKRLGVQEYHTVWAYNALGQWLTQQDAKDNIQRQEYDCTGRLSASYYQVVGSEETPTLALIEYNANGQVILEKAGNGVETHYQYDKKDWRLIKVTTTRPVKEGRVALLQSLNYSYDRVGNLLSVKDDAQAPRFYKNQRVDAEQAYSYDALYQIIKAVGREKAGNNIQGASLPELLTPLSDSHQLQNYTRYYGYDASGNMLSIQHKGAHDYRRDFVVATHSNQSVAQNPNNTLTPEGIRHRFDTHGNLTQLEGGEALIWGPYDLLRETILSSKQKESYQYSQRGVRLRKVLIDENNTTKEEVIYLPGLEIRERSDIRNGAVKERLNVVLISGSCGQVRELQWEIGLPSGVTNHQLRYNYSNHIGSHSLELNNHADILSQEEYYPFGGTAIWSAKSDVEAKYKFVRYSGKERDITGLYYYGYRYYMPWMCRWLSPDPAWDIDGLNLYRMVMNNPVTFKDNDGLMFSAARAIGTKIPAIIATSGGAYGYEQMKNRSNTPSVTGDAIDKTYGDQQVEKMRQKMASKVNDYSPSEQVSSNLSGRKDALGKAVHGELPAINSALDGTKKLFNIGIFVKEGHTEDLNKTELATSAVKDIYNNTNISMDGVRKAVDISRTATSTTKEKEEQLKDTLDDLRELYTDKAITGVSASLGIGATLDAAAIVMPHPVGKVILKGASHAFRTGGVLHTGHQLEEFAHKHDDLVSNELGKSLTGQISRSNAETLERYKKAAGFPSSS
ncbi:RHS repeat domain-containing protein [Vibrio jasicida]|uniref:RHS repeat domain-containing protein n=1 Tax=Vibrio jasicida TaxID=766224 RepID=UPI000CE2B91D|nr:RHS repeat-associated core domain-containing protein [Vibrio jasicida]